MRRIVFFLLTSVMGVYINSPASAFNQNSIRAQDTSPALGESGLISLPRLYADTDLIDIYFDIFGSLTNQCGGSDCFFKPVIAPTGFHSYYLKEFKMVQNICRRRDARIKRHQKVGPEWEHPEHLEFQKTLDQKLHSAGLALSLDYGDWVFHGRPLVLLNGGLLETGCAAG